MLKETTLSIRKYGHERDKFYSFNHTFLLRILIS
jgi:hypothetical protein